MTIPWIRYGCQLSPALEVMESKAFAIYRDDPKDLLAVTGAVIMYYLDIALDLFVTYEFWRTGYVERSAVSLFIIITFLVVRGVERRRQSKTYKLSYGRTSVFLLIWNAFFDKPPKNGQERKEEEQQQREELITIQLKTLEAEGLFEAPTQLTFQFYVVLLEWGTHGSPSFVQFFSIAFSIASLAFANAKAFDFPYLYSPTTGTKKRRRRKIRETESTRQVVISLMYTLNRFLQLVPRIISLSLLTAVLGISTFVPVFTGMVGMRLWVFRHDEWLWLEERKRFPFANLLGSLFSDAFIGDVHFRDHLAAVRGGDLELSPAEVSAEALRVTRSMVWISTEVFLCIVLSVLEVELSNGDAYDPFIVGIMAMSVGVCLLARGVLTWYLFYSPVRQIPEPAATEVPRLFSAYFLVALGCLAIAYRTGVVPNDCFNVDCGSGICVPLTGAYECECYDDGGYGHNDGHGSIDNTNKKAECIDINECTSTVFADTCGVRNVCENTQGSYMCTMCSKKGYVANASRTACEVDVCFDGELLPGELKIIPTTGSSVSAVALVGDLDKDGVIDMAAGVLDAGEQGRVVYMMLLHANRTVKDVVPISSTVGGDMFGNSITGVGDVNGDGVVDVAVGAFRDNDGGEDRGGVYVLLMHGNGTVRGEQKLSSTQGGLVGPLNDADNFGSSVAGVGDLDGDGVGDLVVGAVGDDSGGWDQGAVYVLHLLPTGGVKGEQKISSTRGGLVGPLQHNHHFGASVTGVGDLDGDGVGDLVVGAPGDDDGGSDRGAVFVLLLKVDGSVKGEQKISSVGGGLEDPLMDGSQFGQSVAGAGDLDGDGVRDVVVGAGGDDVDGLGRGAAFVLLLTGDGAVKFEQKINSDQGGLVGALKYEDHFGSSVAGLVDVDGNGFMDMAVVSRDTVYLLVVPPGFVRKDNDVNCLGDSCFGADCGFGSCVADKSHTGYHCECDSEYTHAPQEQGGAAAKSAVESLPCTSDLNECEQDNAGCDQLCINREPGVSCWCGAGFTLSEQDGKTCAPIDESTLICHSDLLPGEKKLESPQGGVVGPLPQFGSEFGSSATILGDLNGDGNVDMAVCAQGDVYVLLLHPDGTVKRGVKLPDVRGLAVAGIGDLNGDGLQDMVVGLDVDDDGGPDHGAVFVLLMRADGGVKWKQKLSSADGGLLGPLSPFDNFGASVADLGDFDGDGVNDLVVGAPGDDGGGINRGAVYVLLLHANVTTVKAEHKISSTTGGLMGLTKDNTMFGNSVAGVGDVDGDGVRDVVVGANRDNDGGIRRGAVYVLLMRSSGMVKSEQRLSSTSGGMVDSLVDNGRFGWSVAGLGDVNGDGVMDIAVGAPRFDEIGGEGRRGAVYVLLMNSDGSVKRHHRISSDTASGGMVAALKDGDLFGSTLAVVPKFDGGDGVLEIFVGAPGDGSGGARTSGAVYALRGGVYGGRGFQDRLSFVGGGLFRG